MVVLDEKRRKSCVYEVFCRCWVAGFGGLGGFGWGADVSRELELEIRARGIGMIEWGGPGILVWFFWVDGSRTPEILRT